MVLVGYSFARFPIGIVICWASMDDYFAFFKENCHSLLLVCVFIVASRTLQNKPVNYDIFLMINNLYRLEDRALANFWFVQALTQCVVILGVVFSIKAFIRLAKGNLWSYSISMLSFFVFMCFLINSFWDTKAIHAQVPHVYLPIIMIGWCACLAKFNRQKLLVFVYAALTFSLMCWLGLMGFSQYVWLVVGTAMLLFLPNVKVFSFVKPFMTEIAAAAYFIYLTHMFILHFIDKLTQNGPSSICAIGHVLFTGLSIVPESLRRLSNSVKRQNQGNDVLILSCAAYRNSGISLLELGQFKFGVSVKSLYVFAPRIYENLRSSLRCDWWRRCRRAQSDHVAEGKCSGDGCFARTL